MEKGSASHRENRINHKDTKIQAMANRLASIALNIKHYRQLPILHTSEEKNLDEKIAFNLRISPPEFIRTYEL